MDNPTQTSTVDVPFIPEKNIFNDGYTVLIHCEKKKRGRFYFIAKLLGVKLRRSTLLSALARFLGSNKEYAKMFKH